MVQLSKQCVAMQGVDIARECKAFLSSSSFLQISLLFVLL